jgi:hypothetical protein
MALPTKFNYQVTSGTEVFHDQEDVIETLADLAGFTAYKVLDENSNFEGYVIEANDKELKAFLEAEALAENFESEQVSALGSYIGDD